MHLHPLIPFPVFFDKADPALCAVFAASHWLGIQRCIHILKFFIHNAADKFLI